MVTGRVNMISHVYFTCAYYQSRMQICPFAHFYYSEVFADMADEVNLEMWTVANGVGTAGNNDSGKLKSYM